MWCCKIRYVFDEFCYVSNEIQYIPWEDKAIPAPET